MHLVDINFPNTVIYGFDESAGGTSGRNSGYKRDPIASSVNTLNPAQGAAGLRRSTHRSALPPELDGMQLTQLLELFMSDINYWALQGLETGSTYRRILFPSGKRISLKAFALTFCYSSIVPALMIMLENNQYVLVGTETMERLVHTLADMYYGTELASFKNIVYLVLKHIFETDSLSGYLDSVRHPVNLDESRVIESEAS